MEYTCHYCKTTFSRRKRGDRFAKYCSPECSSLARRGTSHLEATRAKIAAALIWNTNQEARRSRATRKKISDGRKKRFVLLGYLNTLETRKKIGEAGLGRPAWNKGKRFSKKSCQKMSVAALNRFTILTFPLCCFDQISCCFPKRTA